jgi:hypothetical protein
MTDMESGDLFTHANNIWNNYFCQLMNVHGIIDVGDTILKREIPEALDGN